MQVKEKQPLDPLMAQGIRAIKKFFHNKTWWAGGSIPKSILLTSQHVKLVSYIDLIKSIDYGYAAIARSGLARSKYKDHAEIRIALRIIHECERLGIPQQFIGGLFLMYLKLCEKAELLIRIK